MNQKIIWIILYVLIVAACIYIVINRILLLEKDVGNNLFGYIVLLFFILFTFINIRILVNRIKDYRK
ncbi:MAG: hypothetical protein GX159_05060 [Flavobacteriaceae bacterium]|nr:hypothetical protein [Flavobacteriaceae bacterium]